MEEFSFEKASKFKKEDSFFDINYLWVPGLKWAVGRLYYTSVRPEGIVLLSLIAGIVSAYLFSQGDYLASIVGVFFIQLKNFLDTVDGYLARAKNMTSRLGRFLDSLADALVYICLFTGIAINLGQKGNLAAAYLLSYTAMLSAFLQCSVYNYYLVSYKTLLNGRGINRTDESFDDDDKGGLSDRLLFVLQFIYQFVYGWQDRFVTGIDKFMLKYNENKNRPQIEKMETQWYGDKTFLAAVSPLCFGTQILLLSIFTILDDISFFLILMITAGNLYTLFILAIKAVTIKLPTLKKQG
ncbi:MAG: CDP-alcohol phosphatidyltransferase family protein [Proteobacteria bacterium]|nr:CDP-alcohol phosphatidyltransferase family protein [Pseudomonadota bacterium]